jgi:hypothetical protein
VDLSSIAPNAKRETGLEPAASTLGRCRSVLEFERAQ